MDVQQFRIDFPEFAEATRYTNSVITFYSNLGTTLLDANRWGAQLNYGLELFTAHNIALEALDKRAADAGQIPGQIPGAVANKRVDAVSVGYESGNISMEENAGHWNLTIYGKQFIRLARMIGAGPLQL